jgi:adenine-specific DNA methylase
MTAVVVDRGRGKEYRPAEDRDALTYELAQKALDENADEGLGGLAAVPQEPLATDNSRYLTPGTYGFNTWGKLFNSRQLLALTTLVRLVRDARAAMLEEGLDKGYVKAVATYLAMALDRQADYTSTLCIWAGDFVAHTFGRQALPMVWDFAEVNPIGDKTGNFGGAIEWVLGALKHAVSTVRDSPDSKPCVSMADATRLSLTEPISALVTDPPYYDAVPYADLSDFFYVWLKRVIGDLYPDLFITPLTPKKEELVQDAARHDGDDTAAKRFFEEGMLSAWAQSKSALSPGGIAAMVFAHKTTEAWETLVSALIRAGWTATASWPLHTERPGRLRAHESAALESSVFLACRPRSPDTGIAYLHEVSDALRSRIRERLDYFWAQGIRGADFFVSAIGPALEVYSRHAEVRKTTGEPVTVRDFLELVRKEVVDYALAQVLHNGLGTVDNETRFYVLWRWAYGSVPLEAGEVITFVKPLGVELDELVRDGIVSKKGSKITLKSAADRDDDEDLGLPRAGVPAPIVDSIHRCLNLWRANRRQELADYLATLGEARVDLLKRCAQALSEVLREDDPERRDLHAMLSGGLEPSMRRLL